jgi:hypothetical protein
MWKYEVSNTDHTLMQGVECVNRLVLGEAESTIGIKYESTLDGRNAATHERSHLAGSGDPKRAAASGVAASAATSKSTNPDASTLTSRPGEVTKSSKLVGAGTSAGHRDVGDKDEAHTSEEELGVTTTPRTTNATKGATAKE